MLCEELLKHGAELQVTCQGRSAAHLAAMAGDVELLEVWNCLRV